VPKAKTRRTSSAFPTSRSPNLPTAAALTIEAYEQGELGERSRAEELYRQAIRVDPHLAAAWLGLGREFKLKNDDDEWYRCLLRCVAEADRAVRAFPGERPSHVARSLAHCDLYRPEESVDSARRALEISPGASLHSQMFFLMNFLSGNTPEAHFAEACRWNALYAAPLARQARPYRNMVDPGRPLKIGYVSPDLYAHPVAKFLLPVFEFHDRSQFALTAYSVGRTTDVFTDMLRSRVESFVPCPDSGPALEERIRADGIDILVDLAGHTMPTEQFLVFAQKPAPIQVSWLGVLSTTGLQTMDYFLGNAVVPYPGTEACFSETVYRLPRAPYCYRAPMDAPVEPSPCLERGYITFGSFSNPAKIGREAVRVWAEVLRSVPGSRILLKYRAMDTEVMRDRYQGWFRKEGISAERVQFEGRDNLKEYLASYGRIDIALDPFPYQGGATTMDTLWMGVPMVAMDGRLAVQRASTGILKLVGLEDMVADSPAQYVKAAQFLAGIVGKIPELRRNVRKALQSSPLMDETGFTRELEAAYRDMWQIWCRKQSAGSGEPGKSEIFRA
jgi:predicted O-linked N-acetylglucosamine transferase (SPINDLY family)